MASASGSALAAPPDPLKDAAAAAAAVQTGEQFMKEKRFAEALQSFTEAHRLAASRRTVAEKGLAEQALHLWVPAEGHISLGLEDPDDVWIKRNRVILEEALRDVRSHIGTVVLDIRPQVPNLNLTAAGKWIPWSGPGSLRLPEGEIVLDARAAGFLPWRRTVVVRPGAKIEIPIQLTPAPPPPRTEALLAIGATAAPDDGGAPTWLTVTMMVAGAGSLAYGSYLLTVDGKPSSDCAAMSPCPWTNSNRVPGMLLVGGGAAVALAGVILTTWHPRVSASTSSSVALRAGGLQWDF